MALLAKTYSGLLKFETYDERLKYLFLGDQDRHSPRDISNPFYKSHAWLTLRADIISRDLVSDMGLIDIPIEDRVLVHHINPITREDIESFNEFKLLNPENLITVSYNTHNKIHYGSKPGVDYFERRPGDTTLLRR